MLRCQAGRWRHAWRVPGGLSICIGPGASFLMILMHLVKPLEDRMRPQSHSGRVRHWTACGAYAGDTVGADREAVTIGTLTAGSGAKKPTQCDLTHTNHMQNCGKLGYIFPYTRRGSASESCSFPAGRGSRVLNRDR